MTTVQIIGAGTWGSALALALSKKADISLVTENQDKIAHINKTRKLATFQDIALPENVNVTGHITKDADYTIICTTTNAIPKLISDNVDLLKGLQNIVIASKGMETESGEFLSDFLKQFDIDPLFLYGPNFAYEVVAGKKSASNIAARDLKLAERFAQLLSSDTFYIEPVKDHITVQICSAYKNILSIYCGYLREKGEGSNYRAQICTDGIKELMGICKLLGSDPMDVLSYAGIGDIMLSCFSPESRNFQYGVAIASGSVVNVTFAVEGVAATKALYNKCNKHLPSKDFEPKILNSVYQLISNNVGF